MSFVASALGKAKFRDEMVDVFGNDVKPLLDHTNIKKEKDLTELVVKLNESL